MELYFSGLSEEVYQTLMQVYTYFKKNKTIVLICISVHGYNNKILKIEFKPWAHNFSDKSSPGCGWLFELCVPM